MVRVLSSALDLAGHWRACTFHVIRFLNPLSPEKNVDFHSSFCVLEVIYFVTVAGCNPERPRHVVAERDVDVPSILLRAVPLR